jgi:hypothetical protein
MASARVACHDADMTVQVSAERLVELLRLLEEADRVELKLTVPASQRRATVDALDLDPLDAQLRQVFFLDTPALTLYEHGVVVRARRTHARPDDTVVKLRPVVPHELPSKLRARQQFGVEVDAMPGGFVCSASYKGTLGVDDVKAAAAGARALRKLFSKGQRAFYEQHAPDGLALDDLTILGPITVAKLNTVPAGFARKLVGELWMYPDGSQIIELSTKCMPPEAFDVAARALAFLTEKGVEVTGEQHTKTKAALEFFAAAAQPS